MKKTLLLSFALCLSAFYSNASLPKKHTIGYSAHTATSPLNSSTQRSLLLCDTLSNIHPTDTLVVYLDSIGYVTGQNSFGDLGKADRFSNNNHVGGTVSAVLLYFAVATAANATDTFSVNIWDETAGFPGGILANTNYIYQGAADDVAAQTISVITFPVPPTVQDYFYAGIQFDYAAGDTVALYSNIDGNTVPNTAWELWSDGTSWYPFDDVDSWGLSISMAILPVVCDGTTGMESVAYDKNVAVYPTMASDRLNVLISNSTTDASVEIMDLTGRVVLSKKVNTMTDHTHQFDISSIADGTYMVNVTFGNYHSSKKIIVQK